MPESLTHFLIARKALGRLKEPAWKLLPRDRPNCLRLGSVMHDVLYYPSFSRNPAVRAMPRTLAGADGGDTFHVIRAVAGAITRSDDKKSLRAWLAGLASHIFADAAFHPPIFSLTGDYHHPDPIERSRAVTRHRLLETGLDIFFLGGINEVRRQSLAAVVGNLEADLPALVAACRLEELAAPGSLTAGEAIRAVKRAVGVFAAIQAANRSPFLAEAAYALGPRLPSAAREVAALFYAPRLEAWLPRLGQPFDYIHPVSGKKLRADFNSLLEKAISDTTSFLESIQDSVLGGDPLSLPGPGPSLDTGLPGVAHGDKRHYITPPLDLGAPPIS